MINKRTKDIPDMFLYSKGYLITSVCLAVLFLSFISPVHALQIYKGEGTPGGLVPDFTQTFKDKKGGICAAAAMANSLWFWDQHDYKDIVRQKNESKPNDNWEEDGKKLTLELANLIYGEKYVNDPKAKKTSGLGTEKGVQEYLNKHKAKGKEDLVIRYLDGKDGTYNKWEEEIKKSEDVVARISWCDASGKELPVKKGGGVHALTGVGYDTKKKKLKVSHGWGNHSSESKPYPDLPDTKDYFQEYNIEIGADGQFKIPKKGNEDKDLFRGKGGNADYILIEGFYRISPGKTIEVKDKRLHTPDPKRDMYSYEVENMDFEPIYQFALEVQVPFDNVKTPNDYWFCLPWDPTKTFDVTPAPGFRVPPEEEQQDVVWDPLWRGILWYTYTDPITSILSGFSYEVSSHWGHSEQASFAGLSNRVSTYITGLDQGLTTEFLSTSGPVVPEPSTLLLLGSGLAGIIGFGRKSLLSKRMDGGSSLRLTP